jgi:hypothetical protein
MDWTPYILSGMSAIIIPSTGYMIRQTITLASKLKSHEATDAVRFENIATGLTELKNGQQNQTDKLDRLIEKLL